LESGRFKVFDHLNDWWEEFRLYHRRNGKVFKENDDILAATRYACMSLRFAETTQPLRRSQRRYGGGGGGWMAA
jgi:hypothetical protein